MDVWLRRASIDDKHILERLMQLYMYDFSEFERFDIGRDGVYQYEHLDSYWTEPERHAYLICVDDELAGFVLVNSYVCLDANQGAKSIAEFFVMRKYRREGVGRIAAAMIFDLFPGKWEVRQISSNVQGQQFWKKIIGEYTRGRFTQTDLDNDKWRGTIQSFDNSGMLSTS